MDPSMEQLTTDLTARLTTAMANLTTPPQCEQQEENSVMENRSEDMNCTDREAAESDAIIKDIQSDQSKMVDDQINKELRDSACDLGEKETIRSPDAKEIRQSSDFNQESTNGLAENCLKTQTDDDFNTMVPDSEHLVSTEDRRGTLKRSIVSSFNSDSGVISKASDTDSQENMSADDLAEDEETEKLCNEMEDNNNTLDTVQQKKSPTSSPSKTDKIDIELKENGSEKYETDLNHVQTHAEKLVEQSPMHNGLEDTEKESSLVKSSPKETGNAPDAAENVRTRLDFINSTKSILGAPPKPPEMPSNDSNIGPGGMSNREGVLKTPPVLGVSVKDKLKARRQRIPRSPRQSEGQPVPVVTVQEETKEERDGDLALQLAQLQGMVGEMKEGFVVAMDALSRIQYGDEVLTQKVDSNQAEYQEQLTDVINMVLTLKGEFGGVLEQLHEATDAQRGLQGQVHRLQCERDILLEELEKAGAISPNLRRQYHSGQARPTELNRSSSNTTLAILLERARNTFAGSPGQHGSSPLSHTSKLHSPAYSSVSPAHVSASKLPSPAHKVTPHQQQQQGGLGGGGGGDSHNSSQADSGVAGLLGHTPSPASRIERPLSSASMEGLGATSTTPPMHSYMTGLPTLQHAGCMNGYSDDLPAVITEEGGYESDSSITAAANKSLDLSRSLGNCCSDTTTATAAVGPIHNSEDDEDEEEEEGMEEYMQRQPLQSEHIVSQSPFDHSSPFKTPQSSGNRSIPRVIPPHERNAAETQRSRVAREIVETERKYCSTLWTVLDHFALPIRDCGYLNPRDVCLMFPTSLSRIYDLHCDFLQQLENRLLNWKYNGVLGDLFARFIDSPQCNLLAHYQQYVNEFPTSLQLIKKLSRSSTKLRRLLKVLQRHPVCESLDLSSFLLGPIQRVPRYVLLLKQLLKYTAKDHPDHYHLETSLHKLATFLTRLNDSIEQSMYLVSAADTSTSADLSMQDSSPKPRRKLRIPSFRQSSSTSGQQDSSVVSGGGDSGQSEAPLVRRGSTGPFGSFLRDKKPSAYQSSGQLPHTPRKLPNPPPSLRLDATPGSHAFDSCNDTSPAPSAMTSKSSSQIPSGTMTTTPPGPSSNTLPLRARKRRNQLSKRPKSGGDFEDVTEVDDGNSLRVPNGHKSVTRVCGSGKAHSQSDASEVTEEKVVKDLSRCRSAPSSQRSSHRLLHRSLPRIPHTPHPGDYGIFGQDEEDDEGDDECAEISGRQRSQSHGDVLKHNESPFPSADQSPPLSPSQYRINASVARSLSQRQPMNSQMPRVTKDAGCMTLPHAKSTGARSSYPSVVDSPGNETLNETMEVSVLNMTEPTGNKAPKRRGWRKNKKQRQRLAESMIEPDTNSNRWKMPSFKTSLKNIFFRKRGSRVLDDVLDVSPTASLRSLPTIHSNSHLEKAAQKQEEEKENDPVSAV